MTEPPREPGYYAVFETFDPLENTLSAARATVWKKLDATNSADATVAAWRERLLYPRVDGWDGFVYPRWLRLVHVAAVEVL